MKAEEALQLAKAYTRKHGGGGSGEDGYSPIAIVEQTDTGAKITITDKNGTTTATITDGKTPVKGTDYWTEDDKQEIVNDVLSQITNGNEVAY